VVNFDDSQCVASRDYGNPKSPLTLVLKQPPLGEVIQVGVLRSGTYAPPVQVKGQVQFGDAAPSQASVLAFGNKDTKRRAFLINLPRAQVASNTGQTTLRLQAKSQMSETFLLSGVAPLMKVMDECVAGLQKIWNVQEGPDSQSPLAKRATANLAQYINSDDYPHVAVSEDASGAVGFALLVDEQGKVADCTVIETSGYASLDAQSCAILRERAKFTPAVGKDGKPAKDSMVSRIRWQLF
jgi:TonB family protein